MIVDLISAQYSVTNEEYGRYLEANPDEPKPRFWDNEQFNRPRQPVVGVSWEDAQSYCRWAGLRLPSEAEWEYACRAGTETRYHTGDSEEDLDLAGWYGGNSGGQQHEVGEKEPNRNGLYDMHGNVWEWVEDDWHGSYEGAPEDSSAWVEQTRTAGRVRRGGAFGRGARDCRSACRAVGPMQQHVATHCLAGFCSRTVFCVRKTGRAGGLWTPPALAL